MTLKLSYDNANYICQHPKTCGKYGCIRTDGIACSPYPNTPPNYPVPAIPYDVSIDHDTITVWKAFPWETPDKPMAVAWWNKQ